MITFWKNSLNKFISLANQYQVKMLMVGGGAVNFHGYQRHSVDVGFWIDTYADNLNRLITVFNEMGYKIDDFPNKVKQQQQNISVKFSPIDIDLELITNFSVNKSFDEALKQSDICEIKGEKYLKWNVLNIDDLILSKIKANRPKDLLDIQELKKINKNI